MRPASIFSIIQLSNSRYDEYKDLKTTELALEVKTRIEETIKKSGKWD